MTQERKETTDILMDKKEEILATKRLFQIHQVDQTLSPEDVLTTERLIVGNFNYLTENGKMSRDEYYALFQRCEAAKDFAQIALMTRDFLIERAQAYLAEHPDLPQSGDALNPGRGNIRSGIMWNEEGRDSIRARSKRGGKIAIIDMGGPALREMPDWILDIKEEGMSMAEVYALLEEGGELQAEKDPSDPVVDGTVKAIEDAAEGAIGDAK